MSTKDYISNCFWRIQRAEVDPSQIKALSDHCANAVEIAATSGIDAAHDYLIGVSTRAENGAYANPATLAKKATTKGHE